MPGSERLLMRGVAVAALAATAACAPEAGGGTVAAPEGVELRFDHSSRPVPAWPSATFGLLGDSSLCVMDGYEVALWCGDRRWADPAVVAREGPGPGEVQGTADLVAVRGGGLAVYDGRNRRLSFLAASGELEPSIPVDVPFLRPTGWIGGDSVLTGFGAPPLSAEGAAPFFRVDLTTGTVSELSLELDAAWVGADSAVIGDGVVAPDGRLLVRITADGRSALAWYGPDGAFRGLLELPDFGPVYPTERDVEKTAEDYRMIFRRALPEEELRRYSETPLKFFRRSAASNVLQVDSAGRVWALSTRPSEGGSYLEVFEGVEHAGAVAVDGRVLAIRVRGGLLAALVEGAAPDSTGLYPRRIDYYRIAEAPPGQARSVNGG